MKTKQHPLRRDGIAPTAHRRHALSHPMRTPEQGRAPHQEKTPVPPPLRITHACADVGEEGLNLMRSSTSDDEGSYLVMSLEVPATSTTAYEAWVGFEELPFFMKGMESRQSFHGGLVTWRVRTTLFDQFVWRASVCALVPFDQITWKSTEGTPHPNFGSVSFEDLGEGRSQVMIQIGFHMGGIYRWLGDPVPDLAQTLEDALRNFHKQIASP